MDVISISMNPTSISNLNMTNCSHSLNHLVFRFFGNSLELYLRCNHMLQLGLWLFTKIYIEFDLVIFALQYLMFEPTTTSSNCKYRTKLYLRFLNVLIVMKLMPPHSLNYTSFSRTHIILVTYSWKENVLYKKL